MGELNFKGDITINGGKVSLNTDVFSLENEDFKGNYNKILNKKSCTGKIKIDKNDLETYRAIVLIDKYNKIMKKTKSKRIHKKNKKQIFKLLQKGISLAIDINTIDAFKDMDNIVLVDLKNK